MKALIQEIVFHQSLMEGKQVLWQSHSMPVDTYEVLNLFESHIWESTNLPPSSTDGVQTVI